MKVLSIPVQNDDLHLSKLANNHELKLISPHININLTSIKSQYKHYDQQRGNAWNIVPTHISAQLKDALLRSYDERQDYELTFIRNMRNTHDEVCPMCGGKFPWSLDHILPKGAYPEWAIFSKNLVPACRCNIRRGITLKGNYQTSARILHPYYDDAFETRQLSCNISSSNGFKWIRADIVYLQNSHPDISSIKFHVENVVMRSGLEKFLTRTQWSKLLNQPGLAIASLFEKDQLTEHDVISLVQKDLRWHDQTSGTPNNWNSIFLHGVLNSAGVIEFITKTHNNCLSGANLNVSVN